MKDFDLSALLDMLAERVASRLRGSEHATDKIRPRLLTVQQSAEYLGRTKASIQHMVAEGILPTVRSDRRVFLDVTDLDRWIEQHKQAFAA